MTVPFNTDVMSMLTVRMVIPLTCLVVTDVLVKMDLKEMERLAQKVNVCKTFYLKYSRKSFQCFPVFPK